MMYYAVKIHQLPSAQHITETGGNYSAVVRTNIILQIYNGAVVQMMLRWKMGCFLSTGTVLLTAKPSSLVMSRGIHCIFPVYSFVYIIFLPYGELTVQYLQNLTQFGSTLVNISFPFIQSKKCL